MSWIASCCDKQELTCCTCFNLSRLRYSCRCSSLDPSIAIGAQGCSIFRKYLRYMAASTDTRILQCSPASVGPHSGLRQSPSTKGNFQAKFLSWCSRAWFNVHKYTYLYNTCGVFLSYPVFYQTACLCHEINSALFFVYNNKTENKTIQWKC